MAQNENLKPAYRCEWREVVALNFNIDPRLLRPHLPAGTRVLRFGEHTLLTIMAKNIREFRPWGKSLTLFRSLDEIDIRSYASYEKDGHVYRGHFKLKNLVSSRMASRVIRLLTRQPQLLMTCERENSGFEEARRDAQPVANYRWTVDESESHFRVTARNVAKKGEPNSKEHFVLQQTNQFVRTRKGTLRFPVRQTPWLLWSASSGSYDCDTSSLLEKDFRKQLSRPSFVLLSRGGEVTVSKGRKI